MTEESGNSTEGMTSQERVLAAIDHRRPDRVPTFDSFWADFRDRCLTELSLSPDVNLDDYFGIDVGIAFQIADDVLDYTGTQQKVGKTLGRDLDLGKPTLPTIHALRHADPAVRAELALVLSNGHSASRERICGWLEEAGSIEYAYAAAADYVASARSHLDSVSPSPARDSLWAITEFVIRRQH